MHDSCSSMSLGLSAEILESIVCSDSSSRLQYYNIFTKQELEGWVGCISLLRTPVAFLLVAFQ